MELRMILSLPRDELSIPVVRRTLDGALKALGVPPEDAHDIEVAVTEACTNVLDHVREGDEYELTCSVSAEVARVEVKDAGQGFNHDELGHSDADAAAEEGRGIQLIRALTDNVRFERREGLGSIVRFEKRLNLPESAPARRLSAAKR